MNYKGLSLNRDNGYSGVFLACDKAYSWHYLTMTTPHDVDAVACRLNLSHRSLIIIAVYRPPNSDFIYLQSL